MLTEEQIKLKIKLSKQHSLELFVLKAQTVSDDEEHKIYSAMDYVNGYVQGLKDVLEETNVD